MIQIGDATRLIGELPAEHFQTCITSPPYFGLRDYEIPGQIGLEPTPAEYVDRLRPIFAGIWRALKKDGTLWLNMGDSYNAYNGNAGRDRENSATAATGPGRSSRAATAC